MGKTGVISGQQLRYYKHNACPSCGACSFMGTASTMQIMAEALGLMLPGTALMPATAPELKKAAYDAGVQLLKLLEQGIRAQDIVTKESFENAVMVHAAISGSTNATMHLPAIAHEFGIEIDADTFDRMHRGAHYLLNIRPSGDWPAQYFCYAGGVPRVMEEIRSMLHLDAMTVTGKTLGENLDALKRAAFTSTATSCCAKNRTSEPQAAAHRYHPHVRKRQGHRRQHCHSQGQPLPRGLRHQAHRLPQRDVSGHAASKALRQRGSVHRGRAARRRPPRRRGLYPL